MAQLRVIKGYGLCSRRKPIHFPPFGNRFSGATVRMYIRQSESDASKQDIQQEALGPLIQVALETSKLKEFTGRDSPTVIT